MTPEPDSSVEAFKRELAAIMVQHRNRQIQILAVSVALGALVALAAIWALVGSQR